MHFDFARNTRQRFCVVFVGVVAFSFCWGYFDGWSHVHKHPSENIVDTVAVSRLWPVRIASDALEYEYACKGHIYFRYSTADARVTPVERTTPESDAEADLLEVDKAETILALTTGLGLTKVLGTTEAYVGKFTSRQKSALAVGALSSYFAGRWLALRRLPACDDKAVLSRVADSKYWDHLLRESFRNACDAAAVHAHDRAELLFARIEDIERHLPPIVVEQPRDRAIHRLRAQDSRSIINEWVVASYALKYESVRLTPEVMYGCTTSLRQTVEYINQNTELLNAVYPELPGAEVAIDLPTIADPYTLALLRKGDQPGVLRQARETKEQLVELILVPGAIMAFVSVVLIIASAAKYGVRGLREQTIPSHDE
jgi:hypothetical protein